MLDVKHYLAVFSTDFQKSRRNIGIYLHVVRIYSENENFVFKVMFG